MLGLTRDPCEAWMRIVARGATDAVDGCLRNVRYLLCDRDPLFSRSVDRVIPLGEQHLRRIVAQYVRHYNTERNHQGIGNRLIEPTIAANDGGAIQCRERLGGLLRFYHREAA